jgi:hypothetical protein
MQLDFIGRALNTNDLEQLDLFSSKREPVLSNVDKFFLSISKEEIETESICWNGIIPQNDSERFKRWIFSFLSVHSTWEANVKGYEALKNWTEWFNNWDLLYFKLKDSKIGLHNERLRYIKEFSLKFWNNPSFYTKQEKESWSDYRNKLQKDILGLGFAKVSFAIEMIYVFEARVACMDTHLYQAYKLNQSKDKKLERVIENHFVSSSILFNIPPAIARAILWNRIQNQKNSSYWNYVFK